MDLAVAWLVFPAVLLVLAAGWGGVVTRLTAVELPARARPAGRARCRRRRLRNCHDVLVGGSARDARRRRRSRSRAGGGVAMAVSATRRRVARECRGAGLRRLCGADRPLRGGDVRRLSHARRHRYTFFAMTDRMLDEGRNVDGLAPSTYEATLSTSLMVGYPMGSLLPLGDRSAAHGAGRRLRCFEPYLAVLALMLALVLWRLLASGGGAALVAARCRGGGRPTRDPLRLRAVGGRKGADCGAARRARSRPCLRAAN